MKEKIELQYPVKSGETEITELNIRRPKVRDQVAADSSKGSDSAREVRFFANLCEVDEKTIGSLDLVDYKKLQGAYEGFLA